jgi:drug/metabolite transporter (DMT)-like permease
MKKLALSIVKRFNEKWGVVGFVVGLAIGFYVYFTKVRPIPYPTMSEEVLLLCALPLAIAIITGFFVGKDMFN